MYTSDSMRGYKKLRRKRSMLDNNENSTQVPSNVVIVGLTAENANQTNKNDLIGNYNTNHNKI